jgi:hypothetical protein
MTMDKRFPFGAPTNRKATAPELTPIPGRPNWFIDKRGQEHYREPGASRPPDKGGPCL